MLSVIIRNNGEDKVIQLTYELLWAELKDIPKSELLVSEGWFDYLPKIKNNYICLVEPDCLVSPGYFKQQLNLLSNNPYFRKLAVLSSATAINRWDNKIYGYELGNGIIEGVIPVREKKSRVPYPVQVAFIPGSILRVSMLRKYLTDNIIENFVEDDLVNFSAALSLGFWNQGTGKNKSENSIGNRVHINPDVTYVTTENYVNNIDHREFRTSKLVKMFEKESI